MSLFTCLRNKDSKQADFVEATRTLTNLILSEAMSLLPSEPATVQTPVPGACYTGLRLPDGTSCLCVVSILRAADSMAQAISNLHPGMPVGKILIQRDEETALPKLFFRSSPSPNKQATPRWLLQLTLSGLDSSRQLSSRLHQSMRLTCVQRVVG